MHIRKLGPGFTDQENCAKALLGRYATDDEFLTYPATTILVAEDGKDQVFMPVQTCFVMDTMGIPPGTSDLAIAKAMKQFVSILVWESNKAGMGELLFVGNNEQTNEFACNNQFELMPYKVYRLKVNHSSRSSDPNQSESDEESHGIQQQHKATD